MALTGRFAGLIALGVLPLVLTNQPWVLWAWLAGALALLGIDLALAASPRLVLLERELPTRVRLGERAPLSLLISNTGVRTMRASLRDHWQPSAGMHPAELRCVLPAGERRRLDSALMPIRRGQRRSTGVTVRSFGPLRLAARQATLGAEGGIRVLPPFHSRKHLPSRLNRLRELDGQSSVMVRGQGTEFDSLRDYVRGDDVRSLDWRATARRQELVVRTWRPERDRRVVIMVDAGRTAAARIGGEIRLDSYFESALLLAALASRAGDRVSLFSYDRRVRARVAGVTGSALMPKLMDTLAELEPELIETDWDAVPAQVKALSSQRALVVLLTAAQSLGTARGLLEVLPQLTARHTVVVATVHDPEVLAAASVRTNRDAAYLAAAAERELLEQRRLTATLRRLGAEVVAAEPGALPPALADRYLALKAAGRL